MSLRLLIDEDSQSRLLVSKLRMAGHDVTTVSEQGLMGNEDAVVLARAHVQGRTVLTRNADDYKGLHDAGIAHSGILAIFEGSNTAKNMSLADVVKAVGNLGQSGLGIECQFIPLNAWNY